MNLTLNLPLMIEILTTPPPKPDQPTEQEKLDALNGLPSSWGYIFDPVLLPSTAHTLWTRYDWIRFIGDNWYRKPAAVAAAAGKALEEAHPFGYRSNDGP